MAPQSADSSASVPKVGQATCGHVRLSLEPPTSLLVLSGRSPNGGSLQCPVSVLDRAVSLHLSLDSSSREDSDQDQGGSGRLGHCRRPQLAEEILVPRSPPDDVRDSTPAHMQTEFPVTTPA